MLENRIPLRERLIFALDVPGEREAKALVEQLGTSIEFYKLGLELFTSRSYFSLVSWLQDRGKKVFADLKLFDVPATVGRAVRQLRDLDLEFCTVHGNDAMLAAAVREKGNLKILAVTALTSLDRNDLDDLGFQCDVETLVHSRARRAIELGCDGIVSSGLEIAKIRKSFGDCFLIVSPGIRPVENVSTDDQKRVVSVEQAFSAGADYIVVGRPIRDAQDPRATSEAIQASIAKIFSKEHA